MDRSLLEHIDAVVAAGKAVVSADDATIVSIVRDAVESDTSASFYLSRRHADAVREWYWTPAWTEAAGIRPISAEEVERIRTELGVDGITNFRFSPVTCECGEVYGAYEFLQQGVREHGLAAVNAVFALSNSTFLQVNPTFVPVCPVSGHELKAAQPGGITYDCDGYGGCCCCSAARAKANAAAV